MDREVVSCLSKVPVLGGVLLFISVFGVGICGRSKYCLDGCSKETRNKGTTGEYYECVAKNAQSVCPDSKPYTAHCDAMMVWVWICVSSAVLLIICFIIWYVYFKDSPSVYEPAVSVVQLPAPIEDVPTNTTDVKLSNDIEIDNSSLVENKPSCTPEISHFGPKKGQRSEPSVSHVTVARPVPSAPGGPMDEKMEPPSDTSISNPKGHFERNRPAPTAPGGQTG